MLSDDAILQIGESEFWNVSFPHYKSLSAIIYRQVDIFHGFVA